MFGRLLLLFVLVPIVELALLVQLGRWVGLWPTLLLVFTTGVAGAALARREGLRTWIAFQEELAAGRLPGGAMLDGLAILVGGAFLLTPGVLTDVVGFSLLLPPSRALLRRRIRRWLERRVEEGTVRIAVWPGGPSPGAGAPGSAGTDAGADPPTELDPRKEIRR